MNSIMQLQGVSVRFQRRGTLFTRVRYHDALVGVSIDINPSETLGIIGRNGSGKSTLLRVVAGLIWPDAGTVINQGYSVTLLAHQAGFDPNLTGRDNVILNGMLHGCSRREIENLLPDIFSFADIGSYVDEPIQTYSSGMRARLSFSIANAINPDILLVDEILSVGDAGFRTKAEAAMLEKANSRRTCVLVSHSHHQIARLCERVILMDAGSVIYTGSPTEALERYDALTHAAPE